MRRRRGGCWRRRMTALLSPIGKKKIMTDVMKPRAVVCLSGGMDSTVCAALAARECEVYALHFSYGQRTERREFEAAAKIARLTGAKEFLPLRIDVFRRIGGSALAGDAISVPEAP